MAGPTAFPELDGVLTELVEGARSVLGENFCGAYLHGSFATGDADAFSDVDFMVVTRDELTDEQEAGLQVVHRRIYALEPPWARHLEGSYAPAGRLRRVDRRRSPFLYLDNVLPPQLRREQAYRLGQSDPGMAAASAYLPASYTARGGSRAARPRRRRSARRQRSRTKNVA